LADKLLVEVISEGPHCVPCEYCISAVRYVAQGMPRVRVKVVETKRAADAQRYLELSAAHGGSLPVPSVIIAGRLAFDAIPEVGALSKALAAALEDEELPA
jgi:glutaredoxin